MAAASGWRAQIEDTATDRRSGATAIAQGCATALLAYLDEDTPAAIKEIEDAFRAMAVVVMTCQSAMAPVANLFNQSLRALAGADGVEAAKGKVRASVSAFMDRAAQASERLARIAIGLLPTSATIMTISYSAAVAETLLTAQATGRSLRVICLESRPNMEGRALAEALTKGGVEVVITTDAACYANLAEANLFLVGADSLTIDGVLNKMGTAALAVSAQSCGVPGYALATTAKVWPEGFGRPLLRDYGPDEIWNDRPDGVIVRNHIFDLAPWQAFSGVVTEEGILGRDAICQRCKAVEIHPVMNAVIAEVHSRMCSGLPENFV